MKWIHTLDGASATRLYPSQLHPLEVNGEPDTLQMIAYEEVDEVSPESAIDEIVDPGVICEVVTRIIGRDAFQCPREVDLAG